MPHSSSDDKESIYLNDMPVKSGIKLTPEFESKWNLIYDLRQAVNKALEIKRNDKVIGKSLEADIKLYCDSTNYDQIKNFVDELAEIFIVSRVEVFAEGMGEFDSQTLGTQEISVTVDKASGEKCERCWAYSDTVGNNSEHPALCARCAAVVK